jgi:cobaltochelatase CobN
MHLLATTSWVIDGAAEAVDLNQSPGDIIILSAADSELASLARAADHLGEGDLRLANLLQLQHNMSVDLYVEKTLARAKLIVLRLLGGASYWRYGLDQVEALARSNGIALAVLPGDANADPELVTRSTLHPQHCERLRQYFVAGGANNAENALRYCRHLVLGSAEPAIAEPFPSSGVYRAVHGDRPHAALIFYRSVIEGGLTAPVDALIAALDARGIGTTAIFVASLKDAASAATIDGALLDAPPDIILNATSFSAGNHDPLAQYDCPVLQVVFAGSSEEQWQASPQGLGPRDLAMNVVLPELDGRILSRAVSFKADAQWHDRTQCRIITYKTVPDRIDFVADLAANWVRLRRKPPKHRNIAIVLANYPDKEGRIANGVGYDTPASTIAILDALKADGYSCNSYPASGNDLISLLSSSRRKPGSPEPNEVDPGFHRDDVKLEEERYNELFQILPPSVRTQITMALCSCP